MIDEKLVKLGKQTPKHYNINEIFYSIQGEGIRAGSMNFFVRFQYCNMRCDYEAGLLSPGGFSCETEFVSGRKLNLEDIYHQIKDLNSDCYWLILTGGEPGLQVDDEFVDYFHSRGYKMAIETNGSIKLVDNIDWITVSPKVAEHAIKQLKADEVKYVRGYGQAIPKTVVEADYKLISPAFDGLHLDPKNLQWCIDLVKSNPEWRLSLQTHKFLNVR